MSNKNLKPKLKQQVGKPKQIVEAKKTQFSNRKYLEIISIFFLVFITYGNSIKNGYNLDDSYIVSLDNANQLTQKGISGIPEILKSPYNEGEGVTYGYRPLAKVTMAIEYSLWKNNPVYSHFVNLLLYILNVYLLLLFMKKIAELFNFTNQNLLYVALLLFIIHPLHTEVVCSIKNREEILCYIFLIAAVLLFFKFTETKKWQYIPLFFTLMLFAFLSKETAFNIFGILALIIFCKKLIVNVNEIKFNRFFATIIKSRYTLIFIVAFISFILFRKISQTVPVGDIGFHFEQNPYHFFPAIHSIPNGLQTVFFYIKKLFVPFPMLFYYGYDMLPLQSWSSASTIVYIFAIIIFSAYLVFNLKNKTNLFLIFWILFFFLTLFPFSNFIYEFNVTGIVAERLVYQASLGFCVILSVLIFKLADFIGGRVKLSSNLNLNLPLYITILIAIPFLILTINRNTQWKTKKTLFDHDIQYLSNSARANFIVSNNYMKELGNESLYSKEKPKILNTAKNYLFEALKVYPDFDDAWINLGIIHYKYLSEKDSAVFDFKKVNNSNIYTYSRAQELLGDISYLEYNNKNEALIYYFKGFNNSPKNKTIYKKITQIYFEILQYDSIINFSQNAIKNNWIEGYIDKGDAFLNKKDTTSAIMYYDTAISKGYNKPMLFNISDFKKRKKMF